MSRSRCSRTWWSVVVFSRPISALSPWLDMLIRTDDEVFGLLDAQQHRRWIKTHTPLDGIPVHPTVTYITVVRHPLDVALSDRDHRANTDLLRASELRSAAAGVADRSLAREPEPIDVADYLRWFIDNDVERWPGFVEAATLESMRDRAAETAPDAHLGLWQDPQGFFRSGGHRDWASLLTDSEIAHFHDRLRVLASAAAPWVLTGRARLRE